MSVVAPLLWSLPWTVPPLVALWRARHSKSLDDVSPDVEASAPRVSVIVPARNERRNIERCVRSILTSQYPNLELIVVDDHSTDGTGEIARGIAAEDSRIRVLEAPALPDGWFGKQWACWTGVRAATGSLFLFTDADTWHGPELLPRAVNALHARHGDLLSIAGRQEMHSFWERVIQPQMFGLLAIRYGGTEHVSGTRSPADAIANGQFILVRRDSYETMGGHEAVRHRVAEDLSMAQSWVAAGKRILLLRGEEHFSTHMYASLHELVGGWRKNIYAGGRTAALGGAIGRALFPAMLLAVPVMGIVPIAALVLLVAGLLSKAWLVWSACVIAVALFFWGAVYVAMRESPLYALLYPLGLVMLLYIALGAVVRGNRVEWKTRTYVSS